MGRRKLDLSDVVLFVGAMAGIAWFTCTLVLDEDPFEILQRRCRGDTIREPAEAQGMSDLETQAGSR